MCLKNTFAHKPKLKPLNQPNLLASLSFVSAVAAIAFFNIIRQDSPILARE
jgi:hypothetical protein